MRAPRFQGGVRRRDGKRVSVSREDDPFTVYRYAPYPEDFIVRMQKEDAERMRFLNAQVKKRQERA